MLNLQSKFGQKLMAVGNWLTSLISINLVWFAITLPFWIMLIFWLALPQGLVATMVLVLLWLSGACFLIPATTAVFSSVRTWLQTANNTYFKTSWRQYLTALRQWPLNLGAALLGVAWLQIFVLVKANPLLGAALMALGILALMAYLSVVFGQILAVAPLQLWLAQPVRFIGATLGVILMLGLNIQIHLLFLFLLCSMSLSAWFANKLIKHC